MSPLDRQILAEKVATIERHLARVEARLPKESADLRKSTDASDAVVLHLWQAVQIVMDLALSACVRAKLGTPATYADAFRCLAAEELLDEALAERLVLATGFRNAVVHDYGELDMTRVHEAALKGPADLRSFLAALRDMI